MRHLQVHCVNFTVQAGNLVTWDLTTNETTVLVSHDLLTSISTSGAQFKVQKPEL